MADDPTTTGAEKQLPGDGGRREPEIEMRAALGAHVREHTEHTITLKLFGKRRG